MLVAFFLSLFLAGGSQANKNDEPLVSATNPTYLSCTFWTGKTWSKPAARSARTPVVRSPRGLLAYGEVKVEVQNEDCENTTTLYVAAGEGKEYRSVYKKDGGGNGIRIIGWSPDGDRLLVEVTSWIYERRVEQAYSAGTNLGAAAFVFKAAGFDFLSLAPNSCRDPHCRCGIISL